MNRRVLTAASIVLFALVAAAGLRADVIFVTSALTPGANNTFFQTDLQISNPTTKSVTFDLVFYNAADAGTASTVTLTLQARATSTYSNVLATLFHATAPAYGPIRLVTTTNLAAIANVYNTQDPCGTMGFSYPALPDSGALSAGSIGGLEQDSTRRSNLMLFNPGATSAMVTLPGAYRVTLDPNEFLQLNNVASLTGVTTPHFYESFIATAPILAMATVIDRTTGQSYSVLAIPQ